jgi:hypothetical protein
MNSNEKIEYLQKLAALLGRAVNRFNKSIPQPLFETNIGGRFRYRDPNPVIYLVLKMSRVVTGLYAALNLTKSGLFEDSGAICRIILECSHDIDFVMEGLIHDPFPGDKQEFLDSFFKNETLTPDEMLRTMTKPATIPRKKVYPSVGRLLSPDNPDRQQRVAKVLEESFSGYVHAAYPHIMEMYEGVSKEFRMSGIEARIDSWINQLAITIHTSLNQFSILAKSLALHELRNELVASVNELEKSEAYE